MSTAQTRRAMDAATLRQELEHPIVDGDGHIVEVMPVFVEYLRDTVGEGIANKFAQSQARLSATPEERRNRWLIQPNLWGAPTKNTLDRATAALPALYARRMDELG